MARPRKCKKIYADPKATYYKPRGIPIANLKIVTLDLEEFEAIRLVDYKGLKQESASKKMGVSQPTVNRLLKAARKKIARAIVEGRAIRIEKDNKIKR